MIELVREVRKDSYGDSLGDVEHNLCSEETKETHRRILMRALEDALYFWLIIKSDKRTN